MARAHAALFSADDNRDGERLLLRRRVLNRRRLRYRDRGGGRCSAVGDQLKGFRAAREQVARQSVPAARRALYGLTGRRFDGKAAASMGFVNYAVPLARRKETMAVARDIAAKILPRCGPRRKAIASRSR
jgi:hypothetical protein